MNVLSLFDGISCGQIALQRAGIEVTNYFASEVDKYAKQITQKNYPQTMQIGDVREIKGNELPKIHLMFGGSPCQGFSSAGKQLNFKDPRSALFFEFVRVLREVNPDYFLFENVQMRDEWIDIISDFLGVRPIFINSSLVSAQDRKRLYWTNIPNITLPEDKGISFADISEDGYICAAMRGRRVDPETNTRSDYDKSLPLEQYIECRTGIKSGCLTTVEKDNVAVAQLIPRTKASLCDYRYLSPLEYERLQTVPEGYTEGISMTQRKKVLGNGWTVDVIAHILSFMPN